MIEFKNVSFSYNQGSKKKELNNINLNIKKGEVVLVCGESGCGKTTLIRLINGLIPHYYEGEITGKILVKGKEMNKIPLAQSAGLVGTVFQNPRTQFFCLDTTSELAFGCENLCIQPKEIHRRVEKVAIELNITKLLDRSLFALSGGEKQRIACASVSTVQPDIYAMDEPSSNLDIKTIEDLKGVINKWKLQNKTIVVVEHRLNYMLDIATRVIYMKDGKIDRDMAIHEFKSLSNKDLAKMGLRSVASVQLMNEQSVDFNKKIKLKNFQYSYGNELKLNIDELDIPIGSVVGVIGNNGAGKSTFGKCLCALDKKGKGKIYYHNKELKRKEQKSMCYMVMQDVNHQLFTESVIDEIELSISKEDKENNSVNIKEILESLNIWQYKEEHPMSLSGGQRQRVAVASAIASKRNILVFDEPTSGLDYKHMLKVANWLKALAKSGRTIFVITHDEELVSHGCNYFIFIDEGKVMWKEGKSLQIQQRLNKYFHKN